jgi:hypothetical protein
MSQTKEPDDTQTTGPEARVDELRQRLRTLGYLDAGVDRFVLASAHRTQRPEVLALFASLRIGVLAAVLLGPSAAIGLTARFPGLVLGPRDAAVVAIYLGLLFGACAATASFVAALIASWLTIRTKVTGAPLVRRARVLAMAAGTIVTAASLAYLTLWWRTAGAEGAWSSPGRTALALAVAAGISLLLGHAVTVTALAMTMALPGREVVAAPVPGASWKASFGGAALAFLGAAALLAVAAGPAPGEPAMVPLTVSKGARTTVLAIDGFDRQLHERLRPAPSPRALPPGSAANVHPLFPVFDSALVELQPSDSRDPARLWTTIATGVRPERHGVNALETRRVVGLQGRLVTGSTGRVIGAATDLLRLTRPATASNFERRVKTFWEVAEEAGLRTAVVNWWATWPATTSRGIVISDRAVLRLERGGPLDAELAPTELYEPLRAQWPEIQKTAHDQAQISFLHMREGDLRAILTRSGGLDLSMLRIADRIGTEHDLDLLVVYLPGLDIAQHALLAENGGPSSAFQLDLRLAALHRYYAFLDRVAGGALRRAERAGHNVFVITQAGRLHQGRGILAALGAGLQMNPGVHGTVLDVAPTILHALGVPLARDLDGRVVTGLFNTAFLERHPVRFVDTYGRRGAVTAARGEAPLDQEMIDRLRSLGYVR